MATTCEPVTLSDELRDGILQDLVAIGLILGSAQESLSPGREGVRCALDSARRAIDADVWAVRSLIERLRRSV